MPRSGRAPHQLWLEPRRRRRRPEPTAAGLKTLDQRVRKTCLRDDRRGYSEDDVESASWGLRMKATITPVRIAPSGKDPRARVRTSVMPTIESRGDGRGDAEVVRHPGVRRGDDGEDASAAKMAMQDALRRPQERARATQLTGLPTATASCRVPRHARASTRACRPGDHQALHTFASRNECPASAPARRRR